MTSDRWRKVEDLFNRALDESSDPAAAQRVLSELSSADPDVREIVERLLNQQQRTFLKTMTAPSEPPPRRMDSIAEGTLIAGRYRIQRFLGAGGMGGVYEAADLTLSQRVALKTILPDAAGQQSSIERFKQETALARKVTHANVCRVFDVGVHSDPSTHEDVVFLTMELLPGETLAERLRSRGPLNRQEALPLIRQVSEALAAAHDAGVVHGDFKPGNIMLTEGRSGQSRAVVMDFGLARSFLDEADSEKTRTLGQGIAGTPAYMAPELFTGVPASASTDLYALGTVIYEMVAGARPFKGETPLQELIKKVAEKPPSLAPHLNGMSRKWDGVVARCLDTKPENRFGDAREIPAALEALDEAGAAGGVRTKPARRKLMLALVALAALIGILFIPAIRMRVGTAISGGVPAPDQRRVVILPFTRPAGDPSLQAMSDGLVETLTSRLSMAGGRRLSVAPATEVFRGGVSRVAEARRQFGADVVVTGSMQRAGAGIRLTLNLVDATSLQQLASAVVDDESGDVQRLQETAVAKVGELMNVGASTAPQTTSKPAAYEQYLQSVGYLQRWEKDDNLNAAIELLEESVRSDPEFALGYARLADAYRMKYALDKDTTLLTSAASNAKRAVELNPGLAPVQVAAGRVYAAMGEHDLAMQALDRALKLDGSSFEAHLALAGLYEQSARDGDAEAAYQKAISLQPGAWRPRGALAEFYYRRHRFTDAIREWQGVLSLTPDNVAAHANLGACLLDAGRLPEARSAFEKSITIKPTHTAYMNLGTIAFREGKYAEAARQYERALELNQNDYLLWGNLGAAYFWAPGMREKASAAFERASAMAEEQLKLRSRDPLIHADLANYYGKAGKHSLASTRIGAALALAPADLDVLAIAAEVYESAGQRAKALEYAKRAVAAGYAVERLEASPDTRELAKELRR